MCTNHAVVKITPDKGNVSNYFSRVSKRFSCSISLAGNCTMIIHTLPIPGQYNTRWVDTHATYLRHYTMLALFVWALAAIMNCEVLNHN